MQRFRRPLTILLALSLLFTLLLTGFVPTRAVAAAGGGVLTWGYDGDEEQANGAGWANRSTPGPALLNGVQLSDFKVVGGGSATCSP